MYAGRYDHWLSISQMEIFVDKQNNNVVYLGTIIPAGTGSGGNSQIMEGLATLGAEAFIITLACVLGSCIFAWGLWYLLYKRKGSKE